MPAILITGAAQGIGLATARLFVREGWRVIGLDSQNEALEKVSSQIGFESIVCDLSDPEQIEKAAQAIDSLDVLVNNAATSVNTDPRTLLLEEWNRVLAVNLTAPFLLSRLLADKLTSNSGSIINIVSTRALMSEPFTEAYSASKGGLLSLTHAMAMSLAPIRVNAISPGWIEHAHPENLRETDRAFHPAGRVGCVEDIAQMVWFLSNNRAAGFITGQNFVVDGGVTKKMVYPE